MTLKEAYLIIQNHEKDLFLQADHICIMQEHHTIDTCPLVSWEKIGNEQIANPSAVYTEFDAKRDKPEQLKQRCAGSGSLKPPPKA